MNKSRGTLSMSSRVGERGNSRVKFLIIITVVAIAGFVGFQYIPVAFQSYQYADFMQQTVDKGAALSKPGEWVKEQLSKNGAEYGIPADAKMTIEEHEGALQARVQFKRQVSLIAYTYDYEFDKTVKSSSLWSIK